MNPRLCLGKSFRTSLRLLGAVTLLSTLQAAGIYAVTRRTAMSGVPLPGAGANGTPGPAVSPQPGAATAVLLPGQAPLNGPAATPTAAVPPPLIQPGPGEALLPRPVVAAAPPPGPRVLVRPATVKAATVRGTNTVPTR